MLTTSTIRALLAEHLTDPGSSWSVGTFGAIAEFNRTPCEAFELSMGDDWLSVATMRGALQLVLLDAMRPFAYESLSGADRWQHAVALCLPQTHAVAHGRTVVTELGLDNDAVKVSDRGAVLFDLGFACHQLDVCVRTSDRVALAALRSELGNSLLASGSTLVARMPILSPHRAFITPCARAEVYQRIPAADGESPEGPHTHVLPQLLRLGRTHAATVPIPDGWVPCAHLYPAHPMTGSPGTEKSFNQRLHSQFQQVLEQWGDPSLWRLKGLALEGLALGSPIPFDLDQLSRHERTVVRVAIRQWLATNQGDTMLPDWTMPDWACEFESRQASGDATRPVIAAEVHLDR